MHWLIDLLRELGMNNEDIRTFFVVPGIAATIGVFLLASEIRNFVWRWKTDREMQARRSDDELGEERRLSGMDILEEFEEKRDELLEMMGDSALMSVLGAKIRRLVDTDLPVLLERRRYLLEYLPKRRSTRKRGKKADARPLPQSSDILVTLHARLGAIDDLIAKMRVGMNRLKLVIVDVRSGLKSDTTSVENELKELQEFSEVVRESVAESVRDGDSIAEADREMAKLRRVSEDIGRVEETSSMSGTRKRGRS
jgi:hypothetical protein